MQYMFFRSIRFRITILYMAILALTLSLFSLILYHYVSKSLYDNTDALLRSKAEGIVYAINAYWTAEKVGLKKFGAVADEHAKNENIDFATGAQRWVESKSRDPKLLDIIVQIFDINGKVIASSKNTQGITSVSDEKFNMVLEGKSFFDILIPSFPTKKVEEFRVFVTPAIENDKVAYVVQVSSPLSSIQTALNTLRVTLFVLFPVTVLLTGIMGTLLAKMTLRPVDSMINTIHDITAENMKLKLTVPPTKDEIQKLAETFNDMLLRLDHAFTSQKQLFEDLSHELKTPLTILKGEFEVILKKVRSREEYENILRSSLEEVDKITELVDKLLLLATFESKKILPDRKELDLNLLIQGVVNNIKRLASRKEIAVNFSQQDSVVVSADEQQLKHIFLNLLDNAVKYTPPKGSVTINVDKDKSAAKITIKDTGMGIPEDKLKHIFDRFYRVDKSISGQGFGLGLSIVKSIVDAHKGIIKVESRLGRGTTFVISLPFFPH